MRRDKNEEWNVDDELAELLNSPTPPPVVKPTSQVPEIGTWEVEEIVPEVKWEIRFNDNKNRIWWSNGPKSDVSGMVRLIGNYLDGRQLELFHNDVDVSRRISKNWLELRGKI